MGEIKKMNGTKDLKLTLSADNLGIIKWFVDALYAIHNDFWESYRCNVNFGIWNNHKFVKKAEDQQKELDRN